MAVAGAVSALVLFDETSLQTELFSQARFWIQRGSQSRTQEKEQDKSTSFSFLDIS